MYAMGDRVGPAFSCAIQIHYEERSDATSEGSIDAFLHVPSAGDSTALWWKADFVVRWFITTTYIS